MEIRDLGAISVTRACPTQMLPFGPQLVSLQQLGLHNILIGTTIPVFKGANSGVLVLCDQRCDVRDGQGVVPQCEGVCDDVPGAAAPRVHLPDAELPVRCVQWLRQHLWNIYPALQRTVVEHRKLCKEKIASVQRHPPTHKISLYLESQLRQDSCQTDPLYLSHQHAGFWLGLPWTQNRLVNDCWLWIGTISSQWASPCPVLAELYTTVRWNHPVGILPLVTNRRSFRTILNLQLYNAEIYLTCTTWWDLFFD